MWHIREVRTNWRLGGGANREIDFGFGSCRACGRGEAVRDDSGVAGEPETFFVLLLLLLLLLLLARGRPAGRPAGEAIKIINIHFLLRKKCEFRARFSR